MHNISQLTFYCFKKNAPPFSFLLNLHKISKSTSPENQTYLFPTGLAIRDQRIHFVFVPLFPKKVRRVPHHEKCRLHQRFGDSRTIINIIIQIKFCCYCWFHLKLLNVKKHILKSLHNKKVVCLGYDSAVIAALQSLKAGADFFIYLITVIIYIILSFIYPYKRLQLGNTDTGWQQFKLSIRRIKRKYSKPKAQRRQHRFVM